MRVAALPGSWSIAIALLGLFASACDSPPRAAGAIPAVHRAAPVACSAPPAQNCGQSTGMAGCQLDSDCSAGTNGRCGSEGFGGCFCQYDSCASDADCGGQVCDCPGSRLYAPTSPSYCVTGNCRIDADCGTNGYCSPTLDVNCGLGGDAGWYCHTAHDGCTNDSDCTSDAGGQTFCGYHPERQRWECTTTQCVS